jgi:hypothetical protein
MKAKKPKKKPQEVSEINISEMLIFIIEMQIFIAEIIFGS